MKFWAAVLGILGIFLRIAQNFVVESIVFIFLLIGLSAYSFSIFAGIKLFKNLEKKLKYSAILQYLQILAFSFKGFSFMFTSGISFMLGAILTDGFKFNFYLNLFGDLWKISYLPNDPSIFLYLNIIPLIILYLIFNVDDNISEYQEKKEFMESITTSNNVIE